MMPKELRQERRTRSVVGAWSNYTSSCIRCSHVSHRDVRFHKGKRVKFSEKAVLVSAESGQKWNKGSNADFTFESGIYICGKNGPITVHFRSKKVGTLNGKRFRAGVVFRQVCKTIKIVGKVYVYERLLTNFVEKMLHKHSDWVPKNYWFTKLCR